MKIYTLWSGEYSDTRFWGAFSTREKAQQWIDRAKEKGLTRYCELGFDSDKSGGRIEEYELDELNSDEWDLSMLNKMEDET